MPTTWRTCVVGLLLVLGLTSPAAAKKLKVPQKYTTVQEAVDAAEAGDKIVIGSGHVSPGFLVEGKTGLTIIGKPGHKIEVTQPADPGVVVSDCTDVTLRGLRVTDHVGPGLVITDSSKVVVRGCVIEEAALCGIRLFNCSEVTLRKNKVLAAGEVGIRLGDSSSPSFNCDACELLGNSVELTGLDVPTGASGILVVGFANELRSNKLSGNDGTGIVVIGDAHELIKNTVDAVTECGIAVVGAGNYLFRNVITDPGDAGIVSVGASVIAKKNRVYRAGSDGLEVRNGNGSELTGNRFHDFEGDGLCVSDPDAEIVGNRFYEVLGTAIDLDGSGSVNENRIYNVAGDGAMQNGIDVSGDSAIIVRNWVFVAQEAGMCIRAVCADLFIGENRTRGGLIGIVFSNEGQDGVFGVVVRENVIKHPKGTGITDTTGMRSALIEDNTIKDPGRIGFLLSGALFDVKSNTITGAGRYGIEMRGTYSQFTGNKATGSAECDLKEAKSEQATSNIYLNNTFPEECFGP